MKIISVRVYTNSKKPRIVKEEGFYRVWLKEKPVDGLANKALIEVLADFLDLPKSSVLIKSGDKNRNKLIEIDDNV